MVWIHIGLNLLSVLTWAQIVCNVISRLSADNLCKQFESKSRPTERRSWPGFKLFDTLIMFLKEFFEKIIFEKKTADDKSMKNYQAELTYYCMIPWISVIQGPVQLYKLASYKINLFYMLTHLAYRVNAKITWYIKQ